jgi:predicted GNAT family acetyltransferase
VRLYVDRDNAGAREVYQRLGLSPTQYQIFELDFMRPTPGGKV